MRPEAKKYFYDIQQAANLILRFAQGKSFQDYQTDALLRSGVERQFEIIGEALSQLARIEVVSASRISDYSEIIAFRNILVHGYSDRRRARWKAVESE
jgi:uncharacterized protein with HEPN domain